MFTLQHIHKSYRDKPVIEDVSLSVNAGEVIALIGENGAGKTTLLKIILGELEPDSGSSALRREVIGYVPQEAESRGTIQDCFEKQNEDWKVDYTLRLVGLESIPKTRAISSLSGGQKTRLALAKVLATDPEPTLLLLDEPTNNLDAHGLKWLEQFIKSFKGGIVLVSHDRNFINKVATSIAELHNGQLKQYGGDYDFYKQQKEIEYHTELAKYEGNIEERNRLQKTVKHKAASLQQVSSERYDKIKHEDKGSFHGKKNTAQAGLGRKLKALNSRLEQLKVVEKPESSKDYRVTLGGSVPPAKLIVRAESISKVYGDKCVTYPDFEIRGTERLHIQGANGSGKTTLLKMVAGLLTPDSGDIELSRNIKFGYFSQDVNGLDYDLSNFDNLEVTGAAATAIHREARSLGLDESDLRKKPSELSRGQQAKLSFAKLLLSQNHLLVLDEPTNHLDLPTREKIEAALQNYQGAMLVASHDTYFTKSLRITKTLQLLEGRRSHKQI